MYAWKPNSFRRLSSNSPPCFLGREHVAGLGEIGDAGGEIHGSAVDVAVLEDHGPGLDADMRGRRPGARSTLAHLERGSDGGRRLRE